MKTQYKLVGQPTSRQLQKINAMEAHTNYKQEDLYVFEFTLCNNLLDSCFTKLSDNALQRICDKCIGSNGYINIPNDTTTYTARIFNALIYTSMSKKCYFVKAYAYIVRTKASQKAIDFIEELMSKQAVDVSISISGSGSKHICNICNADNRDSKCHHIPGEVYDGVRCERTICGMTDFYDWSITENEIQNKINDEDTVESVTELSESRQLVIDELISIVDKDWYKFKTTKDFKYLYSTLKFIEMLQETI